MFLSSIEVLAREISRAIYSWECEIGERSPAEGCVTRSLLYSPGYVQICNFVSFSVTILNMALERIKTERICENSV